MSEFIITEGEKRDFYNGDKTYIDKDGWEQRAPISDRECMRRCLFNSIELSGLDKQQVIRLYRKFGGTSII
tara:strand:- start:949 stop:1161 length:213 start_codon:yes stop_codon:yes gene_type:complete